MMGVQGVGLGRHFFQTVFHGTHGLADGEEDEDLDLVPAYIAMMG